MKHILNRKIKFKPVIESMELTGDDWQLYTTSMNCEKAAEKLNNTFVACVNLGLDKHQTRAKMQHTMNMCRSYGADDSEPHYVLRELIDMVYGTDTARN